jgi:hypothetical protein
MEKQVTKWDVIQTGFYKDTYQIKLGYYKKDTVEFKIKGYNKAIEGGEKFFPISIPLGDKETAKTVLLMMLAELGEERKEIPQTEDVPF